MNRGIRSLTHWPWTNDFGWRNGRRDRQPSRAEGGAIAVTGQNSNLMSRRKAQGRPMLLASPLRRAPLTLRSHFISFLQSRLPPASPNYVLLTMPKRKRTAAAVTTAVDVPAAPGEDAIAAATAAVLALSDPVAGFPASPRRASTRTRRSTDVKPVEPESPLSDLDGELPVTKKRTPRKKAKRHAADVESRSPDSRTPVVYDIPPVERKETKFTGRLGYACLNTILRATKPEPIFCSRTCRLETIRKNGIEFAKDLGLRNARDLSEMIEWNEKNKIRFFRISSEMFPFASHKVHGYDLEYAREQLKAAGDLARRYGHRLTTHPGQFTQLASPKDDVVTASVRELEYHCQMMRYMELDQDSVIIIHMGGVYGDKETTLARFKENYRTRLTDEMRARLVLENDEICYSPDDLLPVCDELRIPMVLDYHHNWINPSKHELPDLLPLVAAGWARKGIRQKQHLSEPRPGAESVMEKRAHADRCVTLPEVLEGGEVDLMIEAKDKEQAVFHLFRIYGLEPVAHDNLRPEKPPKPFVRGKGRALAGDGDADGEGAAGEDAAEAVDGTPRRRTRARAERKDAVGDGGAGGDVDGETELEAPSKPKQKRRRTATTVVAGDVPSPSAFPRKRKRVSVARGKKSVVNAEGEVERAEELVNQRMIQSLWTGEGW
ncbi:UV-endonuclease UvdE-domain-containing protein [Fomitopsis serialis]|uniref:UV-endonuclease UvdE-domain-containing protein n=1 Tax=Fomitopsis serialis TaxID=139415 RepID=UPI00200821B8|nr:UV-endonuclease UvdE-domain-containing protein [Neoantrodia serialis]KAH9931550.1 UV-endonuclease UvdE-domain-containing protein [Neoantrodia serialis]